MPSAREWKQSDDLKIKTMRSNGATWNEIAAELGMKREAVIDRGRGKLNVKAPATTVTQIQPKTKHPSRGALPAGSRETWDLLTTFPWSGVPR